LGGVFDAKLLGGYIQWFAWFDADFGAGQREFDLRYLLLKSLRRI